MDRDPYTPPSAHLDDTHGAAETPRRPKLVWVIAVIYVFGALWGLLSLALSRLGTIPVPPETQAYYEGLTIIDYGFAVVVTLLNVTGAVLLFRLRSKAIGFLGAAVGVSALSLLYQLSTPAFRAALAAPGSSGMIVGLALSIAVVIYAYRLKLRGILQ